MKKESCIAAVVGFLGVSLFTVLLTRHEISGAVYVALMVPLFLVCICLLCLPRLLELDLKNLRLTLGEIRQVKAEIAEMYGGIENLRKEPLVLDEAKMRELGLPPGALTTASGAMRYTAGCIKRERERLARIFVNQKVPEGIAEAIMDNSMDEKVFKWNGPESLLGAEPVAAEKRQMADESG